jgi:inner membrane protein
MIMKTHLAVGVAVMLFFFPQVSNQLSFVFVLLLATLLPDIDSMHSFLGHRKIFRPLQFFTRHRGMLHSLGFCLIVTGIFSLFFPILALPFFLGYFTHLFVDSFTPNGIRPFWPLKYELSGVVRTGGKVEGWMYLVFVLIDVVLFIGLFI